MIFIICHQNYLNDKMVDTIKHIPNILWTPHLLEELKGKTLEDIKKTLMPISKLKKIAKIVNSTNKNGTPSTIPKQFDWKQQKPECLKVRSQQICGGCWAFSAVGSLSDNRCINGLDNPRVQYSEQYQISCDKGNSGCAGGELLQSMQFLVEYGVPTNQCVDYKDQFGQRIKCPTECDNGSNLTFIKAQGFEQVCNGEESIKLALTKGTIQTGFTIYQDYFCYKKGIYHHVTGELVGGHVIVLVGYGEENGVKFWKARNSNEPTWGEEGYFRILRGTNECDIEEECYLVIP
uniref:Cathepsin B n=1 Tax=Trepomonas sp. PC1 TaxID=1076344 RepID=A0A146K6Y8_9EUKA|eukprot:JAP92602.1 Cathepsin B [Trepomonas sp. PC1]